MYTLTTKDNPRGLCEISPIRASHNGGNMDGGEFMVFPGYKTGSLQIINMSTTEQHVSSAPVTINAHQNELYCIAINQQVRKFSEHIILKREKIMNSLLLTVIKI